MRSADAADPRREPADRRIALFAARRHGVITREEALQLGATPNLIWRRVEAGRWERLYRSVYRLAGAPDSSKQRLLAACLAWGADSVASHRSAGYMLGLIEKAFPAPELVVPRGRGRVIVGHVIHWTGPVPSSDRRYFDSIPITSPTRTLLDLCSVLPKDNIEEALDDALRRGLTSLAHLRRRVESTAGQGRKGFGVMRELLMARDDGSTTPQSIFETRLLRRLRRAGLPKPKIQYPIHVNRRLVAVVDFAFPEYRIAIEADGYRWHSGRQRWQSDLARRNALTSLGWRVIHVTWGDMRKIDDLLAMMTSLMKEPPFLS